MYRKIVNVKNILILLSILLFVWLFFREEKIDYDKCMGVPMITEKQFAKMAEQPIELDNIVYLEEYLAPYDEERKNIYVSCNITKDTDFYELDGQLISALAAYELYFLDDSKFNTMAEAIKDAHEFKLYAIDHSGNYMTYHVIFTTLPVIELQGEVVRMDERNREIYSGQISVWENADQRLAAVKSALEWNVRGHSSMTFDKKSYKISLKENNGNNRDLSFAGLQSDDDYILNPMWYDDVKVREKLAMDLWNEIAEVQNSNLKMSQGEYCELIINGKYQGLRLLQSRIEKKYLNLETSDMLLKGRNVDNKRSDEDPETVYEIIYANDENAAYRAMDGFFYETDFSSLDLENWIDVQLLYQLGNMIDNRTYKNIYYVIEKEENKLSLIPWDTDMSFGVYWSEGFAYQPESVERITYRIEYEALAKQFPELDQQMAERWQTLRKGVFSKENIFAKIDEYREELEKSGALERDLSVLGYYIWGEEDTVDNLKQYIEKRLEILDSKYML